MPGNVIQGTAAYWIPFRWTMSLQQARLTIPAGVVQIRFQNVAAGGFQFQGIAKYTGTTVAVSTVPTGAGTNVSLSMGATNGYCSMPAGTQTAQVWDCPRGGMIFAKGTAANTVVRGAFGYAAPIS